MAKIRVFLDTDVIISSLLSEKGASFEVLKNRKINKTASLQIQKELKEVSVRLGIKKKLPKGIEIVKLGIIKRTLLETYNNFVYDPEDTHVVSGADISKSKFLLTHNIRHYKIGKIRISLGIIVMTPGNFLQYLRSLDSN